MELAGNVLFWIGVIFTMATLILTVTIEWLTMACNKHVVNWSYNVYDRVHDGNRYYTFIKRSNIG